MAQLYIDGTIFGSIFQQDNGVFVKMMQSKFEMSMMGEFLTFLDSISNHSKMDLLS